MSWIILFCAGLFEVVWAVGLKYTEGFTRPLPTVITVAAMLASLGLLGLAMKEVPLGTAYAIWTGIGAVAARCGYNDCSYFARVFKRDVGCTPDEYRKIRGREDRGGGQP